MRLTTKLCLAYMLLLIIVGAVAGGMYYAKFPFLLYFIVPFAFFGAIGVLPGGFILFLLRIEGWKGRVALVAVCAVMLAAAYRAPAAYRAAHEPPCDQGPYLSWADDPQTSMTVSYTTATERLGAVLYGLAAEDKRQTQTSGVPPAQHHHITLTGLQPDTEYEYDVPALRGGPYRFKTAPAEPHDFSFFVYGDSRPWSGLTNHPAVIR
ncbi:MAG: hypothetical protein GWP08_14120, partial [Nitrospiraceae bacterium]|nr:hypothetical protein [Nitrospiraceae bacterium]